MKKFAVVTMIPLAVLMLGASTAFAQTTHAEASADVRAGHRP